MFEEFLHAFLVVNKLDIQCRQFYSYSKTFQRTRLTKPNLIHILIIILNHINKRSVRIILLLCR